MRKVVFFLIFVVIVIFVARNYDFGRSKHLFISSVPARLPVTLLTFPKPAERMWEIQSIDTMKYSRDAARSKAKDAAFLAVIDSQVKNIAATGATHVAIGTPYDKEFFPMLEKWVSAARRYNLKVWFRGNWCGWEGWFDYPKKMTREEHIKKTGEFILSHPDIFADGDIFSACPECENGGPGDPRKTDDAEGFRQFIISEYQASQEAFGKIGKKVSANYYPMNGDVAKLIMDRATTEAMDGIVVIDHYVKSPERLAGDIKNLQETTGGKIILGEFGAPIPDIHGKMTESQQTQWVEDVLKRVSALDGVGGVNYWVNAGGTTSLWDKRGKALTAVAVLDRYFKVRTVFGVVTDNLNYPITDARITFSGGEVFSGKNGYYEIKTLENFPLKISVSAAGFADKKMEIPDNSAQAHIVLLEK